MTTPFGNMGLPEDVVGWVALGLSLCSWLVWRPTAELRTRLAAWGRDRPRLLALALAVAAAALSLGYVAYYLKGGPRIVDATSYFLEARTFAAGRFSLELPDPSGSFRGRFLLPSSDGLTQAVIFPPGYPAFLAVGFWLQAPMLIGPVTALALVLATYALTREVFGSNQVALLAAALSTLSAALRYHTADTMSHGFSALLLTLSLLASFRPSRWSGAVAGLLLGWLLCTRPLTGMVGVLVCAPWLVRSRAWSSPFLLLPGLGLLALYQQHATGSIFGSLQRAYYALSDGPENCFRLGFGTGVGCLFEHGEFVRRELPNGYGVVEALLVTGRRLAAHAGDITNFVPSVALLAWAGKSSVGNAKARALVVAPLLIVAAYALFYFDGSYPGGGARLFADILPLEHVLLAFGIGKLGLERWLLPSALFGFSLHVGHGHRALSDREGGRPMFEPAALAQANVRRGLVFINTDHGFNLAHDPSVQDAHRGVFVARSTQDGRERALWHQIGRPPAYRYEFDPWRTNVLPNVKRLDTAWSRGVDPVAAAYELEYEWPPLGRQHGWAKPSHAGVSCVSQGRGLRLLPDVQGKAQVQIEWPRPTEGMPNAFELRYWIKDRPGTLSARLVSAGGHQSLVENAVTTAGSCQTLHVRVEPAGPTPDHTGRVRLELESHGSEIVLDTLRLQTDGR